MTKIILENEIGIDFEVDEYEKFINEEGFREGIILLVLKNELINKLEKGRLIDSDEFGIAILFDKDFYSQCAYKRNFNRKFRKIPKSINDPIEYIWRAGIALADKTCNDIDKYPAFFSFILAHELGHAYQILSNKDDFVRCLIAQKLYEERYLEFKDTEEFQHIEKGFQLNLSHEKICDQFGLYFIKKYSSIEKLEKEILEKRANGNLINDHFNEMLEYPAINDLDNMWNEVRKKLSENKEYYRDKWNNNPFAYKSFFYNSFDKFWN